MDYSHIIIYLCIMAILFILMMPSDNIVITLYPQKDQKKYVLTQRREISIS